MATTYNNVLSDPESLEAVPYSSGYGSAGVAPDSTAEDLHGVTKTEEESEIDPEVQPLLQKRIIDKEKGV